MQAAVSGSVKANHSGNGSGKNFYSTTSGAFNINWNQRLRGAQHMNTSLNVNRVTGSNLTYPDIRPSLNFSLSGRYFSWASRYQQSEDREYYSGGQSLFNTQSYHGFNFQFHKLPTLTLAFSNTRRYDSFDVRKIDYTQQTWSAQTSYRLGPLFMQVRHSDNRYTDLTNALSNHRRRSTEGRLGFSYRYHPFIAVSGNYEGQKNFDENGVTPDKNSFNQTYSVNLTSDPFRWLQVSSGVLSRNFRQFTYVPVSLAEQCSVTAEGVDTLCLEPWETSTERTEVHAAVQFNPSRRLRMSLSERGIEYDDEGYKNLFRRSTSFGFNLLTFMTPDIDLRLRGGSGLTHQEGIYTGSSISAAVNTSVHPRSDIRTILDLQYTRSKPAGSYISHSIRSITQVYIMVRSDVHTHVYYTYNSIVSPARQSSGQMRTTLSYKASRDLSFSFIYYLNHNNYLEDQSASSISYGCTYKYRQMVTISLSGGKSLGVNQTLGLPSLGLRGRTSVKLGNSTNGYIEYNSYPKFTLEQNLRQSFELGLTTRF